MKCIMSKIKSIAGNVKSTLSNKRGETSVGTGVAILIAVVLGALLLAGLYDIIGDLVIPELTERVHDIIDYRAPA